MSSKTVDRCAWFLIGSWFGVFGWVISLTDTGPLGLFIRLGVLFGPAIIMAPIEFFKKRPAGVGPSSAESAAGAHPVRTYRPAVPHIDSPPGPWPA